MGLARHLHPIWLLIILATPALGQAPADVLKPPARAPSASAAPPTTRPAPRGAVQQVAPLSTPAPPPSVLGHTAPGTPTPVIRPAHNVHAQKPGTPAAAAQKPPAQPAAKPVLSPAPPPPPKPAPGTAAVDPPPPSSEPAKGGNTGLPLPRFASLRSDEVFLRVGPGTRYPVDWVYRRRDLPVEIEREFEVWRLVEDQDGVKGWVHQATLTGRRSFVVTKMERTLRRSASDDAAPVALLKPGVVGRIRSCEAAKQWCDMQVGDYRGWLRRDEVWGTYPSEAVN